MVKITRKTDPTIEAMWRQREATRGSSHRPHLGGSMLGRECARQLFYIFRWVLDVSHEGRMLALFEVGDIQEDVFVKDLRSVGVTVMEVDPDTGKQWRVSTMGGHIGGSLDGIMQGLLHAPKRWALGEFKTHNEKSFKALKEKGVKESKPEHYDQMQFYMHRSRFDLGINLDRAYYLATNKNNSDRHAEWIYYDPEHAQRLEDRGEYIVTTERPPERISEDPSWFACRFCDMHPVCHMGVLPERNCRTCAHVTPDPTDGNWRCGKADGEAIPLKVQRTGCTEHRYHPHLIDGTPVAHNAETDRVEYEMNDGTKMVDEGPHGGDE